MAMAYYWFGDGSVADAGEIGVVGLSFATADKYNPYLETVYESLMNMASKTATTESERILALLLLTGNMPNLMHMDQVTDIKTQSVLRQPQMPKGAQDPSLKVSGFSNWVIKSNGWNKVTIFPDSTQKPLFADGGKALAKAEMRVESSVDKKCSGAQCDHEKDFVGLAVYFDQNKEHLNLSDLFTIHIKVKSLGTVKISSISKY